MVHHYHNSVNIAAGFGQNDFGEHIDIISAVCYANQYTCLEDMPGQ